VCSSASAPEPQAAPDLEAGPGLALQHAQGRSRERLCGSLDHLSSPPGPGTAPAAPEPRLEHAGPATSRELARDQPVALANQQVPDVKRERQGLATRAARVDRCARGRRPRCRHGPTMPCGSTRPPGHRAGQSPAAVRRFAQRFAGPQPRASGAQRFPPRAMTSHPGFVFRALLAQEPFSASWSNQAFTRWTKTLRSKRQNRLSGPWPAGLRAPSRDRRGFRCTRRRAAGSRAPDGALGRGVERPLERVQARHGHDGLHPSGRNEPRCRSRPLGYEHVVASPSASASSSPIGQAPQPNRASPSSSSGARHGSGARGNAAMSRRRPIEGHGRACPPRGCRAGP